MSQSILYSEICEQPDVIAELIKEEKANVSQIVNAVKAKFDYVVIAARGTSDNAARYAQYLLGSFNQLQVALATPSLFSIYQTPPNLKHALVIGISQSGQSPDIVSVISEGKRQGRPTLAITNDSSSPLAKEADFIIPLHARRERGVAATKTYTTSLTALAMFSSLMNGDSSRMSDLEAIPAAMNQTILGLKKSIERSERYRYMGHCAVLGRGFNYATAFEIALKVKELTRVVAEPYSSADFRHGPIATVTQGFPLMVVAPSGSISDDLIDLYQQLKRMQAELIVISDDLRLLGDADLPLALPVGIPEWLSPLVAVIPGQLFGLYLAIARGLDPDHPVGLRKVTETL